MPTILFFGPFRIMIFVHDHRPPHVHARHGEKEAIFYLDCSGRQVKLRDSVGVPPHVLTQLRHFLTENIDLLCETWSKVHEI